MNIWKRKLKGYLLPVSAQGKKLLLIPLLVLGLLLNHYAHFFGPAFPINTVQIYGAKHLDQAEVQTLLAPLLERGYFQIQIDQIRERLLQLPWVADTFVRRQWPDKIQITVIERQALAIWNHTDLLSTTGELFAPPMASYPKEIPDFIGPNGKQITMMEYFAEINRLLTPLHAKISSLELTAFDTWKLILDNGITLQLGHKEILTRLKAFVKVYPKIIGERGKDVEYIDLRYANGMAVRWKTPFKL